MFQIIESEEEFITRQKEQIEDDRAFVNKLQEFLDNGEHRHINFIVLNVGNLLKICSIYLEIKQDNIHDFLKLEKVSTRNRKMNIIVKELNEKINLRYDFDESEEVIKGLYVYEGRGFIHISKSKFISLLLDKNLLDPTDVEADNLHEI